MSNEVLVAVLVAVIGSGGLWSFIQYLVDTRLKKKQLTIKDINKKLDSMPTIDDVKSVSGELTKLSQEVQTLYKEFVLNQDLTLSIARDRLDSLSNKYLQLGYIPIEDYVSFMAIGESYLQAGGNSEVRTKFELVKNTLDKK